MFSTPPNNFLILALLEQDLIGQGCLVGCVDWQNFMTGASSGPPPYTSTYSSTVDTNYSSYPSQPSMYSTTPATGPPAASYASHYNTSYGY